MSFNYLTTHSTDLISVTQTTVEAFGAIIDTLDDLIYIQIMIKKILQHLTFDINHRKWGVKQLISEITGSVLAYPDPHKKCHVYFYHQYLEYHGDLLHKHYLKSNHRNLLAT